MTNLLKTIIFLLPFWLLSQNNEQLANNYFDRGDFEKATVLYQELLTQNEGNGNFFDRLIGCYQQLQKYEVADKAIQARFKKFNQKTMLIELGYNAQLQKKTDEAKRYFDEAVDVIAKNGNEVYGIAYTFERKSLFEYALKAYQTALVQNPKFNFNFQMAVLQGQLGNMEEMIRMFLDEAVNNPPNLLFIQAQLMRFLQEDSNVTFAQMLRKSLIYRTQQTQDLFWNEFLSWFYVQQHEYGKAFIQQKAIYKRKTEAFQTIIQLGQLAQDEGEVDAARDIMQFVFDATNDVGIKVSALTFLIQQKITQPNPPTFDSLLAEINNGLLQFGQNPYTLPLQKLRAHFLAFNGQRTEEGRQQVNQSLGLALNKYQEAECKLELGDIYLKEEKFNLALLTYSQIEADMSGDVLGQEASLKTAKTSYYKGDFKWALHQLKVLKSASSQLIANDAMDLFLLIRDVEESDSTFVSLKPIARGDFLQFQHRDNEARKEYESVAAHKDWEAVQEVAHFRLGQIWQREGCYVEALEAYQHIIQAPEPGIFLDEALYYSADIYQKYLNDPEKAKSMFETLIFKHEDSIYFIEARKRYRLLRGDVQS